MRESVAEKWVERNLPYLIKEYCLQAWKVCFRVQSVGDSSEECSNMKAYLQIDPHYMRANITLHYDLVDDLAELEEALRHELEHVLMAPYFTLLDHLEDHLPESLDGLVSSLKRTAHEQARHNIGKLRQTLLQNKGSLLPRRS